MQKISKQLKSFFELSKKSAIATRHFDGRLGGGLGFNDLVILYHLATTSDGKMRRIDLANEMGFTASGITRLLAPMEKIGLIKREADANDARVSFVVLASGGKRLFTERLEKAELLAEELFSLVSQTKK